MMVCVELLEGICEVFLCIVRSDSAYAVWCVFVDGVDNELCAPACVAASEKKEKEQLPCGLVHESNAIWILLYGDGFDGDADFLCGKNSVILVKWLKSFGVAWPSRR